MMIDMQKDSEFIMRLGHKMKTILLKELYETYPDHQDVARMYFGFMSNFICNVTADISQPDKIDVNLNIIIDDVKCWMSKDFQTKPDEVTRKAVHYSAASDTISIEDVH